MVGLTYMTLLHCTSEQLWLIAALTKCWVGRQKALVAYATDGLAAGLLG